MNLTARRKLLANPMIDKIYFWLVHVSIEDDFAKLAHACRNNLFSLLRTCCSGKFILPPHEFGQLQLGRPTMYQLQLQIFSHLFGAH